LTCWHTVAEANVTVGIYLEKKYRSFSAQVVGVDKELDVALLKVDAVLPALRLDTSSRQAGEWTAVTGFPYGMSIDGTFVPTTTAGIIGCVRPATAVIKIVRLQLDLLISEGDSGAPVYLPESGTVVGMVTSEVTPTMNADIVLRSGLAITAGDLWKFLYRARVL
jgi:S1-C subfamily serine protease